jgi:hypothetical protein
MTLTAKIGEISPPAATGCCWSTWTRRESRRELGHTHREINDDGVASPQA